MTKRTAKISRKTNETQINIEVNLDGNGRSAISTGSGFFDHMLDQLSKHSLIDMNVECKGDLHIDDHHSVEDCGIAIGCAIKEALGNKSGIYRYGECALVMDEAQVRSAMDFSGRGFLVFDINFPAEKIGTFDTELVREFFQALAVNAGLTLHINAVCGVNSHHLAEAAFKAVARAMRRAIELDPRNLGNIPSTKGVI